MTYKTKASLTARILSAASVLTLAFACPAIAQETATKTFNIEAQPLSQALLEFSRQSHVNVIAPSSVTRGLTANAISGDMEPSEALKRLLGDASLELKPQADGSIVIAQQVAEGSAGGARPFRVAQAATKDDRVIETKNDQFDDTKESTRGDRIVVTGTNIRGIAPDSSPTRAFNREDIEISGAATAQDFIQTLPQNFGGGSNPDISGGLPSGDGSGFNDSLGASVNFRGLGSGSTLVLLNGRRMAPSSGIGDFVDISMIPVSAIDRVDVLLDGASAIYGADAVAGVVNFVLRDDYEGAEASFRYGSVTDGSLDEYRGSLLGGVNWGSGNALLSYEYFEQGNLPAEERSFSEDATLPQDILPKQERHSVLAAIRQSATPDIELFSDIMFSKRDATQNTVTIDGFYLRREPESQSLNATLGASWTISEDWSLEAYGSHSRVDEDNYTTGDITGASNVDSRLWTGFANLSGSLFELPGGEAKIAIGGQYRTEDYRNESELGGGVSRIASREAYEAFGELFIPFFGPDNARPGAQRLELSVSGRFSDFSDFGSTINPKVGLLWSPVENIRLRGSYGTSYKPPALGRVGANDASTLVYSTSLINDLLGLTAADPSIADVVAITVNGTAKDLDAEEAETFTGGLDFYQDWGRSNLKLSFNYFDTKYENRLGQTPMPDNRSSFDAPNIAFESPELLPPGTVVFNPTTQMITDAISGLAIPYGSLPSGLDPYDAAIIRYNAVTRNLGLTYVEGVDFNLTYQYDLDAGVLSTGIDGVILTKFSQQASIVSPAVDLLDTQFNPIDLKLRGRIGFNNDRFSANVFVNYAGAYKVDNTATSAPIGSWTTVDLSLSYTTGDTSGGSLLDGVSVRLSVQNLFDQAPPVTPGFPSLQIYGYDPANASPLNRFISFEVTKRF